MNGTVTVDVSHNFETAHRLPFLGGKCENLHGHSWNAIIGFLAPRYESGMNSHGISCEYGLLKKIVRGWIDEYLDHGCMLGAQDLLLPYLLEQDSKVFVFGNTKHLAAMQTDANPRGSFNLPAPDRNYPDMPWPTVEAVAQMVCVRIQEQVDQHFPALGTDLYVGSVLIAETSTNSAVWTPDGLPQVRPDRVREEAWRR